MPAQFDLTPLFDMYTTSLCYFAVYCTWGYLSINMSPSYFKNSHQFNMEMDLVHTGISCHGEWQFVLQWNPVGCVSAICKISYLS